MIRSEDAMGVKARKPGLLVTSAPAVSRNSRHIAEAMRQGEVERGDLAVAEIDADSRLADDWLQVCQRVSQSEDGLARCSVVAAEPSLAAEAKAAIGEIVRGHGAGEEYQG